MPKDFDSKAEELQTAAARLAALTGVDKTPNPERSSESEAGKEPGSGGLEPSVIDTVKEFNKNARWISNATHRLKEFFKNATAVGELVWDRGLGQAVRFVGRNTARIAKSYMKLFNRVAFTKDKETGMSKFSRLRAAFLIAATLAAPWVAWNGGTLIARPVYDVGMRLGTQNTQQVYLYQAERESDEVYFWTVSASRDQNLTDATKMVIRRNAAYWRWSIATESMASKITAEPQLFNVTTTGYRFRLPYGLIDLKPEIQRIELVQPQPSAPVQQVAPQAP